MMLLQIMLYDDSIHIKIFKRSHLKKREILEIKSFCRSNLIVFNSKKNILKVIVHFKLTCNF